MPAKPDPWKILDLDHDFAVSQEWLDEIRHRCVDIDSGKATLLDHAMVINELRGKFTQ